MLAPILSALLMTIPFIAVSNKVPSWLNVTGWALIVLMLLLGRATLKADNIIAWCEKQRDNDRPTR